MKGGLVDRAPAHDGGDLEGADELLEVQRLGGLGHVLGRDDGALDDGVV